MSSLEQPLLAHLTLTSDNLKPIPYDFTETPMSFSLFKQIFKWREKIKNISFQAQQASPYSTTPIKPTLRMNRYTITIYDPTT